MGNLIIGVFSAYKPQRHGLPPAESCWDLYRLPITPTSHTRPHEPNFKHPQHAEDEGKDDDRRYCTRDEILAFYDDDEEKSESYCTDWRNFRIRESAERLIGSRQFSKGHIRGQVENAIERINDVADNIEQIDAYIDDIQSTVRSHLWIDVSFADVASAVLKDKRKELDELKTRLEAARDGFEKLPKEPEIPV